LAADVGEVVMLERFTERARRVVVLATEEARSRRHEAVGPEHLLMGILRDGAGLAVGVLERLRVDLETLRTEVERVLSETPTSAMGGEPGFSAEFRAVLEATVEEQWRYGHNWVGTEHLLLGLLDARSTISRLLRTAGADLDEARRMTVQVVADAQETLRAIRTSNWRVQS
jgi:ATP-dependent Clp protease ATP-binding subunit ClpC